MLEVRTACEELVCTEVLLVDPCWADPLVVRAPELPLCERTAVPEVLRLVLETLEERVALCDELELLERVTFCELPLVEREVWVAELPRLTLCEVPLEERVTLLCVLPLVERLVWVAELPRLTLCEELEERVTLLCEVPLEERVVPEEVRVVCVAELPRVT